MLTARDLSLANCQAVSAYWRGDNEFLPQLEAWLAQFWVGDGPLEPVTDPIALCPHGAKGHGIRWYDSGSHVLGYVPGKRGCFQVPRTVVLPTNSAGGEAQAMSSAMAA